MWQSRSQGESIAGSYRKLLGTTTELLYFMEFIDRFAPIVKTPNHTLHGFVNHFVGAWFAINFFPSGVRIQQDTSALYRF